MDTSNWTKEEWDYYERAAIAIACAWIQREAVPNGNTYAHVGAASAADLVATRLVELRREKAKK
jgi:hypothetical protein